MRREASFIAVDWGTTNRRAYRIDDGAAVAEERDAAGVGSLQREDYPGQINAMRTRLGDVPMLLAGMVGSSIGWQEAAYVPAPAGLADVAAGVLMIDERTGIVPGVSVLDAHRADVMRGEEVQLLGACAAGLVPNDALIVQPGTHAKWASLTAGRISDVVTAMTGELFALLRRHSILSPQLYGDISPDAAFFEGVAEGRRRDVAASLFGVRASRLLGQRDDRDAAAFASGILIGSEVAARLGQSHVATIHLIADDSLGPLYAAAIGAFGRHVERVDSNASFITGMVHLERLIP